MKHKRPAEPWHAFLQAIDRALTQPVDLYCIGGFTIAMLYGLPRPTVDIDYLTVVPVSETAILEALAGRGSALHATHGVFLQHVGIVTVPENFEQRVRPILASSYRRLRLFGLDPYDLALSKLERNSGRDREDVKFLARTIPLDPALLEMRYRSELRPYLAAMERHDLTIRLWLEMLGDAH